MRPEQIAQAMQRFYNGNYKSKESAGAAAARYIASKRTSRPLIVEQSKRMKYGAQWEEGIRKGLMQSM